MKKSLAIICLGLCVLFAFASCSNNEPRKATEDEARIIGALDKMDFSKVSEKNPSKDDLISGRAITELKINTGDIKLTAGADAGDGNVSTNLDFALTDFSVEFKDDNQPYSFTFDGTLKQAFKAGLIEEELNVMSSLTVAVDVSFNGKNYPVRIEQTISAQAGYDKLYFIGNQQVTL